MKIFFFGAFIFLLLIICLVYIYKLRENQLIIKTTINIVNKIVI